MNYPIEVYCSCGQFAKYKFAVRESSDEFLKLWQREHGGEGHEAIAREEHAKLAVKVRPKGVA